MYNIPVLIIKGFIIGIAKIIPGVSGSLFALNLGIYEDAIDSIGNFFKKPKNNLIFLGSLGIGVIIAIILGSKMLSFLLSKYYLYTMFLFIGLLAGTLPNIVKKNNIKSRKEKIIFFITFLLMTLLCFVSNNDKYQYVNNLYNNIYVILIGIIDAATMIIPGISGTAIFMLMGCYEFFLSIFSNINEISNIFVNFKIIILFAIGLMIGIILTTKIMNYLLKNKKNIIYPIILGFSISSVFILLFDTVSLINNVFHIIIGIAILLLGFKISKLLDFE